mmetsp:Transcript_21551/g.10014  ORF Transcript_21551/g.10014 Transcript_21551/m.10014 type:complete len:159 (-) Transcript_21551:864-1340(-)
MNFVFIMLIGFLLITVQSVFLSCLNFVSGFFDLIIFLVIYAGLFRPFKEGVVIAFFLGLLIDDLSGGPFGIYIVSYLWILLSVVWFANYFNKSSVLTFFILSVVGVLIQNGFIICSIIILTNDEIFCPSIILNTVFKQIVWAIYLTPLFYYASQELKS